MGGVSFQLEYHSEFFFFFFWRQVKNFWTPQVRASSWLFYFSNLQENFKIQMKCHYSILPLFCAVCGGQDEYESTGSQRGQGHHENTTHRIN